ncbi:hypothetical protein GOODEAATRI_028147 [Goodea atripinnis]|uniref:Uncharacterized protein n=1 Tax=Goodea atripinnis TaxID=208336 RepID=A0ABV0P8G7_9TELE
MKNENVESLLLSLEQAASYYASAVALSPRNARLHFLLGLVLEEQHNATEIYGLQRKALDKEYHLLKEQGQSIKSDYVQTLYMWLSKNAGKGRSREALQHIQTGLALRPLHPALRSALRSPVKAITLMTVINGISTALTGLALLQQEQKACEGTEKEAALFLHQGLEHFQGEGWAKATIDRQSLVQKRCQALTALISLTAISPCQELLDMQERKWWQEHLEAQNKEAATHPSSQCMTKRGAMQARGGPNQGRASVSKPSPGAMAAPVRGGNMAQLPTKTLTVKYAFSYCWLWMFLVCTPHL